MPRKRWIRVIAHEKPEPDKAQLSLLDPPPEPVRRRARRQGGASVGGLLAPSAELRGLVRSPDQATSIAAAEKALSSRELLKARVFAAFEALGPMTDGELTKLPQFAGLPVASVSKRRTDLFQAGLLEDSGERRGHPDRPRSSMIVWRRRDS